MQWEPIITGLLSSSPLAGGLGFAVWYLVGQVKEARLEAKAAREETATVQNARIADLKTIVKQNV